MPMVQRNTWHWFDRQCWGLAKRNQEGNDHLAKLTKTSVFKAQGSRLKAQGSKAETPLDKTTRIVRKMVAEEAEQRQAKNDRLRNARLEREANTPTKPSRQGRRNG